MKKRVLLFIIGLVIVFLGIGSCFLISKLNRNNEVLEKIKYGLILEHRLEMNEDLQAYKNYYIINKNYKDVKMYDYDNNLIYSIDNKGFYEVLENESIIIYGDKENILINKKGEELIKTEKNIYHLSVPIDSQVQFLIGNKLYDNNLKEVYTFSYDVVEEMYNGEWGNEFSFYILKNYIVDNNKKNLINYKTNEEILSGFDYSELTDNYIILVKDNKYYFVDLKKDTVIGPYEKVDTNEYKNYYKLKKDNEIIYFDYTNDLLYDKNNQKLGDYIVDYKTCEHGLLLKDSKGNKVINECQDSFIVVGKNIIAKKDDEYNLYLNGSKDAIKYCNIYYDDKYIFASSCDEDTFELSEYIYNYNGEKQRLENSINKYGDYYITFYPGRSILLDENLNEKFSGKEIYCNDYNWCSVNDGVKTSLYDNGKLVYSDDYVDIAINNSYLTIKSMWKKEILVYMFGTENFIDYKTIGKNTKNVYEDINIDEMIKKYELNDIKDIINKDQTLFKKYTYLVEKNDNLNGYQKYVMDMYKVLFDNKEFLEENVFFEVLERLKFQFKEYDEYAAGLYLDGTVTLIDDYKEDKTIIYHELMHFIDLSLNRSKGIYKCGENYYLEDDPLVTNNCRVVYDLYETFIVEAGSELFTGKYIMNGYNSYSDSVVLLEMLGHIFGSRYLKELYFSQNGEYKLLKTFLDSGYTFDESKAIINLLHNITSIYEGKVAKNMTNALDVMIDLYKTYKKDDWLKDEKFKYMVETYAMFIDYSSSKYNNELKTFVGTLDKYEKFEKVIFKDLEGEYSSRSYPFYYMNIDGDDYISIDVYHYPNGIGNGNSEVGVILVKYDFFNKKVLNIEYIAN